MTAWKEAVRSIAPLDFSLGKSYAVLWDYLRPNLDAMRQEYALGRAIFGTRRLHVPTSETLASLGPGPHPSKDHMERWWCVTPDDVAAAAAWMNAMSRSDFFHRRTSKPKGWRPSQEDADRIWNVFEGFRRFYTDTAVRGDAVSVYFG